MNSKDKFTEKKSRTYISNLSEEFKFLYFDKLKLMGIDKCLRLNKEFKIETSENEMLEFFDLRNKHVEACLDKFFALHKIYDEELNIFSKNLK
jgi:hypothetical protein